MDQPKNDPQARLHSVILQWMQEHTWDTWEGARHRKHPLKGAQPVSDSFHPLIQQLSYTAIAPERPVKLWQVADKPQVTNDSGDLL